MGEEMRGKKVTLEVISTGFGNNTDVFFPIIRCGKDSLIYPRPTFESEEPARERGLEFIRDWLPQNVTIELIK